jgi:GTP-binding protein
MSLLTTARFAVTVVQLSKMPRDPVPEVAFVGRSNAGKSSAINTLCNHRKLAFSSRTPGRTQALNLFTIGYHQQLTAYLVDTPGYGYAAVPLKEKRNWDQLAGQYLRIRESLGGVVLMIDSRRGIGEMDETLIGWIPLDVPLLVLLTKCDKLTRQEQINTLRAHQKRLGTDLRTGDAMLFSSLDKVGVEQANQWICKRLLTPLVHFDPTAEDFGSDEPSPNVAQ